MILIRPSQQDFINNLVNKLTIKENAENLVVKLGEHFPELDGYLLQIICNEGSRVTVAAYRELICSPMHIYQVLISPETVPRHISNEAGAYKYEHQCSSVNLAMGKEPQESAKIGVIVSMVSILAIEILNWHEPLLRKIFEDQLSR